MPEMIILEGPCVACGEHVHVELPADGPPLAVAFARHAQISPRRCDACIDREDAEEKAAEEAALAVKKYERRIAAAQMPRKWTAQEFAGLEDGGPREVAIKLARRWSAGDFPGLVLWGDVGRGKTAIAAAAANRMLGRRGLRWLPVAELLIDLRMGFDTPEYVRALRKLDAGRGSAALVLDDLDKMRPTEHAVQPLYVAINAWIEAELPLLVTLNRDLDSLAQWMPDTFGEAIASRLAGYCKVREVGGHDRRLS